MALTHNERAVLAHVLHNEAPEAWEARALANFGPELGLYYLAHKVNNHRDDYLRASKLPGYKTAAEREAIAQKLDRERAAQIAIKRAEAEAADAAAQQAKIDMAVKAAVEAALRTR